MTKRKNPQNASMARKHRSVRNVFCEGSPHQNLPFPKGNKPCNLTAAEIVAYTPHWLRSIDLADRFVTNGSKAVTLAAMINKFRDQPDNVPIQPNSICLVFQTSMRAAGFAGWQKGIHGTFVREGEGESEWDGTVLDVSTFRIPRQTHPVDTQRVMNIEQDPIDFKDLALHVKKHPDGADALDLTRCVKHALSHPDNSWLFPTDFERLVKETGGPQPVTLSHLDAHVFARYHPDKRLSTLLQRQRYDSPLSAYSIVSSSDRVNGKLIMPPRTTRAASKADRHVAVIPHKQLTIKNDGVTSTRDTRRSGRLAGRPFVNFGDNFSDSDITPLNSNKDEPDFSFTIRQKRKGVPDSDDDDFDQVIDESSGSLLSKDDEDVSDELFSPVPARPKCRSAKKARQSIQQIASEQNPEFKPKAPKLASPPISPTLMTAARTFSSRQPKFLKAPILSRDRLKVDEQSIWLYAETGLTNTDEMYASALSSTRFGGPRRSPPFRELYQLSDPPASDSTDWAENIRWAKEQQRVFGSKTWTEYDYHLEQITEERHSTIWVSEEVLRGGY